MKKIARKRVNQTNKQRDIFWTVFVFYFILLPPSQLWMEGMWSLCLSVCLLVCLSVCLWTDLLKNTERICMKFGVWLWYGVKEETITFLLVIWILIWILQPDFFLTHFIRDQRTICQGSILQVVLMYLKRLKHPEFISK